MWGGGPERNAVSSISGLPTSWDVDGGVNVRWVERLGSQTYGNPVVAGGKVFVGTNNANLRDPALSGDRGVLLAFSAQDGRFLWQATTPKLPSGAVNDWPLIGICSAPLVEGERLYYVTNRGELLALDTEGFHDGENDGPFQEEEHNGLAHADVVWRFDMIAEVGTFPHNASASSPVGLGELLFVGTSNGHDESHRHLPAPQAPALVAIHKATGKLAWQDASPGDRVLHGQWSSPAAARIDGVDQVVMGQGDGWVRGFEAATGRKLWELDTNPKDAVWPDTRNEILATPMIHAGIVYIANGQDPEQGDGPGHLYAIDATKRGDITETGRVWHYDKIRRSLSTAVVYEGILYCPDLSGFLHALDAATGAPYWVHDTFAAVWGSPLVVEGRVYLADEDGDVVVLQAGKQEKVLAETNLGSSVYSTPAPAAGTLFIATRDRLFALAEATP
jgi:outer membrane protein assembly factor BamB